LLSILIVNGDMRYMQACLRSIQVKMTGLSEILVVDNGSADGGDLLIEREFPWVKLVRRSENLGLEGVNSLAAREASGHVFLLFNYDTELLRDVRPLADILRQHKELGCLGARMSNDEGVVVDNAGWFPSPIRLMLFASPYPDRLIGNSGDCHCYPS
jgi:GT2 family glycosyltransferase